MSKLLDKTDLKIITNLSRNSRTSYMNLGSLVGLTAKSVKLRIKDMIDNGVIEKFVARVNPANFGYRTAHIVVTRNKGVSKDEIIKRITYFGDLNFHVHLMGRTSMAALIIKESLDDKIVQILNDSLKPAIINNIAVSEVQIKNNLSETDMRIIKCILLSNARMEISEIARELSISEKTVTRRLDTMREQRQLEFSIQCDPASMIGYVQFAIVMNIEKSCYRNLYEYMFTEFQESILYRPNIIDRDDLLIFILFAENVFMIDSLLSKVDSLEGVNKADVFIITKLQFYEDWILREINGRISSPHKSIKVADRD
jgi:DNA-binding Lrp family transcriptional regulator